MRRSQPRSRTSRASKSSLLLLSLAALVATACNAESPPASPRSAPAPNEHAAENTKDACPSDGTVAFTVDVRGIEIWNGRAAHIAAAEGNERRFSAVRIVSSGTVQTTCATAFVDSQKTNAAPSAAIYIDANHDGRCDAGDVGTVAHRYAVFPENPFVLNAAANELVPIERLEGRSGRAFCDDYFSSMPIGSQSSGARACTPGQDQTCNDDPTISSLHGKCAADGTCDCAAPFTKLGSGRCN